MPLHVTDLADALAEQWRLVHPDAPQPVRELHFYSVRRWRFDLAWVDQWLALECEGGVWQGGRGGGRNQRGAHTGGAGYVKDVQKYNEATLAGWHLLRATGDMIKSGEAITLIERALGLSSSAPSSRSTPRQTGSASSSRPCRSGRST